MYQINFCNKSKVQDLNYFEYFVQNTNTSMVVARFYQRNDALNYLNALNTKGVRF